jgi:hypothetical protein
MLRNVVSLNTLAQLRDLLAHPVRSSAPRQTAKRRCSVRLRLEALEDRTCPSATPPTLAFIGDQTMTHTQGHITVGLSGSDADGDPLTYSGQALAYSQAYQLQQQYGLFNPGNNYYFNYRGQSEKYLQGANNQWFFLLSNGNLYQWAGSIASSTLLATNTLWYLDPSQLWNAQAPPATTPASVSVTGNQLTITPSSTYAGTFQVAATVSDGALTATRTFLVTLAGTVPIGPIDHPAAAVAYSPVQGTLFGANGPSYLDVNQGAEGDCWLLSSLAETAARAPADITSMFTYDGTTVENGATVGVYSVRFYNSSGMANYVTVDTELPQSGYYYDHPANGVLWVALAEKAYAQANGAGIVTSSNVHVDSYNALDGGMPTWALQAITGKPSSAYNINPTNLASAWNAGQLIVLSTPNAPASPYIVGDHAYAVVGYNPANSQPFTVFNPWGTDYTGPAWVLFTANAGFLGQNFDGQYLGSGAG